MDTPNYSRIASLLELSIEEGQLRVGERLPSVRVMAEQRRVSPATAVAALRVLEQRGLIEARPRSGYFVAPRAPATQLPKSSRALAVARNVNVGAINDALLANSQGPGVVPLGSAFPATSWFPVRNLQRRIAAVARRFPAVVGEYGPVPGLAALRHQIARRYAQLGCRVDQDEVLITNGCMEALNLAIRAVAEPGATIAVESPTFFGILQIIESFGMKALEIATDPTDGISLTSLEKALGARDGAAIKACVVIANFSNPLGVTLSDASKQSLARICRDHGIALIEDDIYGDLNFGGRRPLPIKSFDRHGETILCSSFSKTLAPGARIGWVVGGAWTQAIAQRKEIASLSTPVLWQQVLADYLANDSYERHLRKLRQSCAAHVDVFARTIAAHFPAGTRLSRPSGGFILWIELPGNADAAALQRKARREHISVLPGQMFSASGRFGNCLRINCGQEWTPRVEAALRRLGQLAGC